MAIKFSLVSIPKEYRFADLGAGDTFVLVGNTSIVLMKTSIGVANANVIRLNNGELLYIDDTRLVEPVDLNIELVQR